MVPKPGHYRASVKSVGDPADIERLADILVKAERPAILFGQQVWACRGHKEAIALLRGLDIPGYFNGASRGLLPPGDPHHFDRTRSLAFSKADVVVIVGTPFVVPYRLESQRLEILAVLHGARQWPPD